MRARRSALIHAAPCDNQKNREENICAGHGTPAHRDKNVFEYHGGQAGAQEKERSGNKRAFCPAPKGDPDEDASGEKDDRVVNVVVAFELASVDPTDQLSQARTRTESVDAGFLSAINESGKGRAIVREKDVLRLIRDEYIWDVPGKKRSLHRERITEPKNEMGIFRPERQVVVSRNL
jgi:hypothetical protein